MYSTCFTQLPLLSWTLLKLKLAVAMEWVPLKDAWARIEPHGHVGAHDGERTRSSRSGLQRRDAEKLNWSEQEAFDDDSRQCDEERRRMDAHASEWKRTRSMDTNCNAMQ